MIYFNCTSVFHTFLISYIMLKEFPDAEKTACIFIPEHVKNLVELAPKIKGLPFVSQVFVVEEACADLNENLMLKTIPFCADDIVFVGGMERIGVWLFQNGKAHGARVIIFEEGANMIQDADRHIEFVHTLGGLKKGDLLLEDIHEIWKLNGKIKTSAKNNGMLVHDLKMRKYLHDKQFLNKFLTCLYQLFRQEEPCSLARIVFFDSYVLAACKRCSRTTEKNILKKVTEVLSAYDYEIKPHPNDWTDWKYEKDYPVCKYANVPVEFVRLSQLHANLQEQIYITYGITGCIANELFLFGTSPYVVFLYKILRLYGIEYPGEFLVEQLYEQCSENQKEKIFFPETFTELKVLLGQISGKEALKKEDFVHLKEKELEDTGRKVRKIYKDLYKNAADELNETSLMHRGGDKEWKVFVSKKILVNERQYSIEFDLPSAYGTENTNRHEPWREQTFRWYIARGAIVKVKLQHIMCFDQENDLMREIYPQDLIWLDAVRDENGWYMFQNCDAMAEFSVREEVSRRMRKIVIGAQIEWDLSYDAMLLLRNHNLKKMSETAESFWKECEEKAKTIEQLQAHLKAWEKEVQNRDEEIKMTIRQREELGAALEREREKWQAAITEKERRLDELNVILAEEREKWQADMQEKEKIIEQLESNWCVRVMRFFQQSNCTRKK